MPALICRPQTKLDAAVAADYGWAPDISETDILAENMEMNLA